MEHNLYYTQDLRQEYQATQTSPEDLALSPVEQPAEPISLMRGYQCLKDIPMSPSKQCGINDRRIDPATLTFGIELELIAVFPKGLFQDHFGVEASENHPAQIVIADLLEEAGVPVTGNESLADDVTINGDDEEDYTRWQVQDEGNLWLTGTERSASGLDLTSWSVLYQTDCIELVSRKFSCSDLTWTEEISKVLGVLDCLRKYGVKFVTNKTTGFHVHIGTEENYMDRRTLKGVTQISTCFEHLLDQLYSTLRIDSMEFAGQHENFPLSFHHVDKSGMHMNCNVYEWAAAIEKCTDVSELCEIFESEIPTTDYRGQPATNMTDGHRSTLNLDNCLRSYGQGDTKRDPTFTIEFRQHESTLDFDEIRRHVELCATLVFFCARAEDHQLLELCAQAGKPNFGVLDLLRAIGVRETAIASHRDQLSTEGQTERLADKCAALNYLQTEAVDGDPLDAILAQVAIDKHDRSSVEALESKIRVKMTECYGDLHIAPDARNIADFKEEYEAERFMIEYGEDYAELSKVEKDRVARYRVFGLLAGTVPMPSNRCRSGMDEAQDGDVEME